MLALVVIQWWHWAAFVIFILFCLALDLGVFHKHLHVVRFREAFSWTLVWAILAALFAGGLVFARGRQEALEFVAGYVIELSLSMDNVFVIALIFTYFRVPSQYQHRVLFWGILGALVMRAIMIFAGTALVQRFSWTLYIFGVFLLFSGLKMLFADEEGVHPEKNLVLRLARKCYPISKDFDGHHFVTHVNGRHALTPLMMVLLMVETTDLIFALDSVPAILGGVTQNQFIVFTSNVFAILGLRSLYFVLAGAIDYFRYLKYGLSIVLAFIGLKMLLVKWVHLSTGVSLGVVACIILTSILASVWTAWREHATRPPSATRH